MGERVTGEEEWQMNNLLKGGISFNSHMLPLTWEVHVYHCSSTRLLFLNLSLSGQAQVPIFSCGGYTELRRNTVFYQQAVNKKL